MGMLSLPAKGAKCGQQIRSLGIGRVFTRVKESETSEALLAAWEG